MSIIAKEGAMALLKSGAIPIGRMLFIPKDGGISKDDLEIESSGQYEVSEMADRIVIKNAECCRAIMVKVRTKE
jgi:hypothetical protein